MSSRHHQNLLRLPLLALAIAIGCLSPIANAVPTNENAALRYWRAIWLMGEDQVSPSTDYDGPYQPEYNHADEGEEPYTSTQLLADSAEVIQQLVEASEFAHCDFGVDYHKGVEALLPHLSQMRKSAQLLVLDAKRLLAEGETDAATERVAAAYRLTEHLTGDVTLINSLVSIACFTLVDDFVTDNGAVFSDDNRRTIAAAIARFDAADPFGCERSIRGEAQIFGGWMLEQIKTTWSTPESFASGLMLLMSPAEDADALIRQVYDGPIDDHEAFRKAMRSHLDRYSTAVLLMADAWNTPDARESLQAIETQVTDGSFGPIAQLMAPALTRAHRYDMESRKNLAVRLQWATN